jgi:hypothetical protein
MSRAMLIVYAVLMAWLSGYTVGVVFERVKVERAVMKLDAERTALNKARMHLEK